MQQENILGAKFAHLETSRYKIQAQLMNCCDLSSQESTAVALLGKIPDEYRELAAVLQSEIKQLNILVKKLEAVNNHNNELIGFSLDYLSFIQAIYEGDVAGLYSNDGQPQEGKPYLPNKNLLDQRI